MNPFPLTALLTRCQYGQALIVLESEPFNGLEIRPHDLQRLAERLLALAVTTARLPAGGKHYRPTRLTLTLAKGLPHEMDKEDSDEKAKL